MILLNLEHETPPLIIYPLLQPLFSEFKHGFPTKIPLGLPLKRFIQHTIDLIPSSTLPNKPTYKMSPLETNEIQRQLDELMAKGMIRDSLIPMLFQPCWCPRRMGA